MDEHATLIHAPIILTMPDSALALLRNASTMLLPSMYTL